MKRFALAALILASSLVLPGLATASGPDNQFTARRCVNMGNALEAFYEGEWGHTINLAHFTRIRAAGFDTIRLPVRWSAHIMADGSGRIDPSFAARVDRVVDAALGAGLNVVLNVHHYNELMEAPDAHQQTLLSLWRQLGERYQSKPAGLSFEVMNEPNDRMAGGIMRRTQAAAIDVIRASNPTRTIILGGEDWSHVETLGTNLASDDPNVIYTFHYYDPFEFTHQNAPWTGPDGPKRTRNWGSDADLRELKQHMASAEHIADILGRPVFLGEFGAYDAAPEDARLRYTEAVRKEAEAAGIGWCVWSFAVTFAIFDPAGDAWVPGYLDALGLGQ